MSYNYEKLKNRMTNGTPFTRDAARRRINELADVIDSPHGLTSEETAELLALADARGVDRMPQDLGGRVDDLETAVNGIIKGEEVAVNA